MSLFKPEKDGWRLVLHGEPSVTGCLYDITLRLDEAGPVRHYTFTVVADWSRFGEEHDAYFQNASDNWYSLWIRDFMRASEPTPSQTASPVYEELVEESLAFESHLTTPADVKQEIVRRMREGAQFRTAHKEGGTTMQWTGGKFVSTDYGESQAVRTFTSEEDFLAYARDYFDMDVRRCTYPQSPPELDAWKLLSRLLWA